MLAFSSAQSLSHIRLFVTPLCDSMPGLTVHHQLPESIPPGFPGGPGVGTLPANAGGMGSVCDPGRPHMP